MKHGYKCIGIITLLCSLANAQTPPKDLDTDLSDYLQFRAGSDLSATRDLTFITGDADRTLDLTGALSTGFNADLLDGEHGSFYSDLANSTGNLNAQHIWVRTLTQTDIQDAIDNVTGTSSTPYVIHLPPGVCTLTDDTSITAKDYVSLVGSGMGATVIQSTTTAGIHPIIIPASDMTIADMSLIAEGEENTDAGQCLSPITGTSTNLILRNCYLFGNGDIIFGYTTNTLGVFENLQAWNCVLKGNYDGIRLSADSDASFYNCKISMEDSGPQKYVFLPLGRSTVKCFGCDISAISSGGKARIVSVIFNTSNMLASKFYFYGCRIRAHSADDTANITNLSSASKTVTSNSASGSNTAITLSSASFTAVTDGEYLRFTDSGNIYRILSHSSTTSCVVQGDATGETNNAAMGAAVEFYACDIAASGYSPTDLVVGTGSVVRVMGTPYCNATGSVNGAFQEVGTPSSGRTISTTSPLTGGGDLSTNRTLAIANSAADGSTKGAAAFTGNDFDASSGVISLDYANGQTADGTHKGFLTSSDWTAFNGKTGTSRTINTTSPITGGGDLSANRTIAFDFSISNIWTAIQSFTTNIHLTASAAPGSPTEGDFWNDSTQKSVTAYVDGIKQSLSGTIYTSTANASVTNTTTETSLIGSGVGTVTLPANFFLAGKTIRVTASGYLSTPASPHTLRLKLKKGSTVILDSGATALYANQSEVTWNFETTLTARSSTTLTGQGMFHHFLVDVGNLGSLIAIQLPNLDGITVSASSEALDFTAQWGSGAGASDDITCMNFMVEVLH